MVTLSRVYGGGYTEDRVKSPKRRVYTAFYTGIVILPCSEVLTEHVGDVSLTAAGEGGLSGGVILRAGYRATIIRPAGR
jgi:hypothetical protein